MFTLLIMTFACHFAIDESAAQIVPAIPATPLVLHAAQPPEGEAQPAAPTRRAGDRRTEPSTPSTPTAAGLYGAQPGEAAPVLIPPEVRVIPLKHANAALVAQLINDGYGDHLVYADARTNAIIYMGKSGLAAKVADTAAKLDYSGEGIVDEDAIVIHRVKHRSADEIVRQIQMTLARSQLRIASDNRSASIVLSGPSGDISKTLAAIDELDRATPPVQLEFAFFTANPNPNDADEEALPTPSDLKSVADELQRFGLVEFHSRLTAHAIQSEVFSVEGVTGHQRRVNLSGEVISSPAGGPVKIRLSASVGPSKLDGEPGTAFNLRTTITANRGEYIVVGSAPATWSPGQVIVLVLHVQP